MTQTRENTLQASLDKARGGDIPGGIAGLRRVVETFPDFAEAWGHLGYLLFMTGQPKEAILCYEKLLALAPGEPEALFWLGDCYRALGDNRRAHATYAALREIPFSRSGEVEVRLRETEPQMKRIGRRIIPTLRGIIPSMRDPAYRKALIHEITHFGDSIPGIRAAGLGRYLTYLARHYRRGGSWRFPVSPCDLCGSHRFRAVFFVDDQKKVKCRRCGLDCVERKPPEGIQAVHGHYDSPEAMEDLENDYTSPGFFDTRIGRLASLFEESGIAFPQEGWSVYEFGCAQGHVLDYFRSHGARVAGCETSLGWVAFCRDQMGLDVVQATIGEIDVPADSWDLVLSYHVAEHLGEPSAMFRRASRMLRRGGFLFLEVPTGDVDSLPISQKLDTAYGYGNTGHMYHFQPRHIRSYLERFGFEFLAAYELGVWLTSGGFLAVKRRRFGDPECG